MIYYPKIYGLCNGSKQVLEFTKRESLKNLIMYKELLHNDELIKDLNNQGIKCIDDLEEISSDNEVIIRAHGEVPEVFEYLRNHDIKYNDGTCYNVKRIQMLVSEKEKEGYQILIFGNSKHPEVIGINGWCHNQGLIIEKLDDVSDLRIENDKIFLVSQTTASEEKFLLLRDFLLNMYPNLEYQNTICNAQKLIQLSACELARDMDLMIVIGGISSENTRELYNKCKVIVETYMFSQNKDFICWSDNYNFDGKNNIGITGGASTTIEQIHSYGKILEKKINN